MNILTSLVPGLRTLRTPLAVGYLWIAVFWLLNPLPTRGAPEGTVVRRIGDLIDHAGVVESLAALTFCAYIIGLVFEVINAAILGILWGSILVAISIAVPMILAMSALPVLAFTAVALAIIFIPLTLIGKLLNGRYPLDTAQLAWQKRVTGKAYETIIDMLEFLRIPFRIILRLMRPGSMALEDYVASSIEKAGPSERIEFLGILGGVSAGDLRRAWRRALSVSSDTTFDLKGNMLLKDDVRKLIAASLFDDEAVDDLRLLLSAQMERSGNVRRSVYLSLLDLREWYAGARNQLGRALSRLRAEHELIFSEYDRCRAEYEFRLGVTVPTAVLLALFLSKGIGLDGGLSTVMVLPVGAALYYQGFRKREEAESLLTSCLEAEIIAVSSGLVFEACILRVRSSSARSQFLQDRNVNARLQRFLGTAPPNLPRR